MLSRVQQHPRESSTYITCGAHNIHSLPGIRASLTLSARGSHTTGEKEDDARASYGVQVRANDIHISAKGPTSSQLGRSPGEHFFLSLS